MILLGSTALNSSNLLLTNLPPFQAQALQLEFKGTANSTKTVALSHLGTLIISADGVNGVGQFILIDISDLAVLNNMYGGVIRQESTVSSSFNFTLTLPFFLMPWDENALHVTKDWLMTIQVTGIDTTQIASGTFEVTYVKVNYPQNYIPYLMKYDRPGTSGSSDKLVINQQNQNKIWLFKNTATISNVMLTVEGGEQLFNTDFTKLESRLNASLNLETFVSNYGVLDLNPTNAKYERLADYSELTCFFTGSGNYRAIVSGTIETETTNKLKNASVQKIKDELIRKAKLAVSKNDTGTVKVLADSLGMTTAQLMAQLK